MGHTKKLDPNFEPKDDSSKRKVDKEKLQAEVVRSAKTVLFIFDNNPNTLQFELESEIVLGRRSDKGEQPDIDLAPYGGFPAGISRRHVCLYRTEDNQILVEDLESRNGTYLDGEKLLPHEKTLVVNGQALRLGGLSGWVFYEGLKSS